MRVARCYLRILECLTMLAIRACAFFSGSSSLCDIFHVSPFPYNLLLPSLLLNFVLLIHSFENAFPWMTDVDECEEFGATACGIWQCQNTLGSFHCIMGCPPGFHRTPFGECIGRCCWENSGVCKSQGRPSVEKNSIL